MATLEPNKNAARRTDYSGSRFGILAVVRFAGTAKSHRTWECLCDCGNTRVFRTVDLLTGRCRSCGCKGHNRKHRRTHTPEYIAWRHIKDRCFNTAAPNYDDYGGRGIGMCVEWRESFEAFFAYVGERPSAKHSIDRFPNNNGNYEPGNVRWATQAAQNRNTRRNVFIEYGGIRLTITDWGKRLGILDVTLRTRIRKWGVERAFTTPIVVKTRNGRMKRYSQLQPVSDKIRSIMSATPVPSVG